MADFIDLNCKHCGGKLKETNDPNRFHCEYCGHDYLRESTAPSTQGDTIPIDLIKCPQCNVELLLDPAIRLSQCHICGEILQQGTVKHAKLSRADKLIQPFTLTKKQVDNILLDWLSNGKGGTLPPDFISNSCNRMTFAVYWPHFVYSCTYEGSWSALAGVNTTKTETQFEKTSTWLGDRKVETIEPVMRTSTTTNWTPLTGPVKGSFTIVKSGIANHPGSDKFGFPDCMFENITGKNAPELSTDTIQGTILEFDGSRDKIYSNQVEPELEKTIHKAILKIIPGDEPPRDVRRQVQTDYTFQKSVNRLRATDNRSMSSL